MDKQKHTSTNEVYPQKHLYLNGFQANSIKQIML